MLGQAVSFTAVVAPGHTFSGMPTGSVDFYEVGPGGVRTLLGSATVNGGKAVLTTTSLPAGTHTVVAVYDGDADFQSSTSGSVTHAVNAPVLLGSISGHVHSDTTGNGLTADDAPMAGVTVKLYADSNHDSVLDAGDALLASATSAADGSYAFSGLAAGKYFVTETTPDGYELTAPTSSTYVESISGNNVTGVDFDNFKSVKCSLQVFNTPAASKATLPPGKAKLFSDDPIHGKP
jgi:hypothetical protein